MMCPRVFLNSSHMMLQRRYNALKMTRNISFRNITENTLADTPSGYIQDPANHPKQMVTYKKLTIEGQSALDALEREEELMKREELAYSGYTTLVIQECKATILNDKSTREELESSCESLNRALKELIDLIGCTVEKKSSHHLTKSFLTEDEKTNDSILSNEYVVVSQDDCNHIRYIIALGMRRLGNYLEAENMCMEILSFDHSNCDALESLIEIYTGTEKPEKLRILFDKLSEWDIEKKKKDKENSKITDSKSINSILSTEDDTKSTQLVEVALILLSDIIIESASFHYNEHGEGSTSRFFLEAISPMISVFGPQYTSLFIDSLFRSMDEQHFSARFETSESKESEKTIGLVIAFLKMLLARRIYDLVEDSLRFEFQILSKLHAALRFNGEKHESYKVCERLMNLYRNNCAKKDLLTQNKKPKVRLGLFEDFEPTYKTVFFQYIEDRALDSLDVGKDLCIKAIEEFPEEASPWETLGLILHKKDPINGLDDAIVAVKKAFSLEPRNLRIILTLANFFKAQKRYKLHEMMIDRYQLLKYLIENGANEEEINTITEEIVGLDVNIPRETEPDEVSVQFADIQEHLERMEMSHTYSMPIDKEPRVFGKQPLSAPMLDSSINADKPERLVDPESNRYE
ncbi:uncharacterized protein TM35_000132080 [Trypanosoma theileri]|uniref:Uncharacterized protein n=1 Tax=Trypanosoma theileri TaxID=67003 RepID=A0A1X0NWX0_9TRYP|nr:uncharacterized protein TM35_000132080 [Trypanosoma theileri]ORC89204.1 hypothetical protein TM35_000132080 [Trypanosoma theileri]